ncbi:hypothetical protein ABPG75_012880 [Micractinium tetrahymenae]
MADPLPGPPPSPGGRRGQPSLLDMPPGVLQRIMQLVLQSEGDEPFPLPDSEPWAGGAVARRLPPHIPPESLLACKPLCQAALAAPPTYVRVQPQRSENAAQVEQQFSACAGSVRMLQVAIPYHEPSTDAGRFLQLALPHLHSLSLSVWNGSDWLAQLPRYPALKHLAISCPDFLPSAEQLQALSRLPVRTFQLYLEQPEEDRLELPAFSHLEVLHIKGPGDVDAWSIALPADGLWLGSRRLHSLVLRQVTLPAAPAADQVSSLESLELGMCTHDWSIAEFLPQLSRLTRLSIQCCDVYSGQGLAATDFSCVPLLRELSLAGNRLTQLPAGVAGLGSLSVLDLTDNNLCTLPPEPFLHGIRKLSLAGNSIERLPPALEACSALEALDVTGCKQLTDAGVLAKLPSLRCLHYALELGWTAQDSSDMPTGSYEAMTNELASLQELPSAVNTARRLALFERLYEHRALW